MLLRIWRISSSTISPSRTPGAARGRRPPSRRARRTSRRIPRRSRRSPPRSGCALPGLRMSSLVMTHGRPVGMSMSGEGRDQHVAGRHLAVARRAVDQSAVGAGQRRDGHTVAPQLVLLHPGPGPDDRTHARQQCSGGRPFVVADSSREAVLTGRAMVLPAAGQNRLAEGPGRDGAGMNAHTPHVEAVFHHRHPLAQLRGLHGGALTRGSASGVAPDSGRILRAGRFQWFRSPARPGHQGCGTALQRDGPGTRTRIRPTPGVVPDSKLPQLRRVAASSAR